MGGIWQNNCIIRSHVIESKSFKHAEKKLSETVIQFSNFSPFTYQKRKLKGFRVNRKIDVDSVYNYEVERKIFTHIFESDKINSCEVTEPPFRCHTKEQAYHLQAITTYLDYSFGRIT